MQNKEIFVSNRLPFKINQESGEIMRSSGGLVSALLGINLDTSFTWLGFETDDDHGKIVTEQATLIQSNLVLRPVSIGQELYENYYDKFCNDTLWPLFHYEGQHTFFQHSHWESYIEANQIMADAILEIANDSDCVWIHDYHFFLLPKLLKEKRPKLKVGVFLHTPFPSFEIFRQLPVRDDILTSVIKADLIGFHEHSYLRHFGDSLKALLGIDSTFFKATIGNHNLHLGVFPISIDSISLRKKSLSDEVELQTKMFYENILSDFLILGVDRLDYSKGLKLKLKGFRKVFQKYPELIGKINLLQVAIPTRVNVPSYINLKNEIDKLVGEINGEFGKPDYTPVNYIYNSVSEVELLALYKRAESILITSKRDGMNLVAMEYSVCQTEDSPGTLILSEFTGAASLMGGSLIINPWDENSIADAIYESFKMNKNEKQERMSGLQEVLNKCSASKWAETFLDELKKISDFKRNDTTLNIKTSSELWPRELKTTLKSDKDVELFLDYDGTLVPFEKRPDLAVLSSKTKELINKLSEKFTVTIVSGRPVAFLEAQFKDMNVNLVAEHGAYCKVSGEWVNRVQSDIEVWHAEVIRVMNSYTEKVPLSKIEIKESSVVWHYRESPKDFALFQARKLDDELHSCLASLPVQISIGSKIVEAKAMECNKGDYIKWKMGQDEKTKTYICIGDDRTDEDMFQAIRGHGIGIKVGTGVSCAQFNLSSQEETSSFLNELMAFI